jgi:hypothetical protein
MVIRTTEKQKAMEAANKEKLKKSSASQIKIEFLD